MKNKDEVITISQQLFDELGESYSGDLIPNGKIRKPVQTDGHGLLVSIGSGGIPGVRTEKCYRLLTLEQYGLKPIGYYDKGKGDGFESARNDPNGFYHGIQVKVKGATYVMFGPPLVFKVISDKSCNHHWAGTKCKLCGVIDGASAEKARALWLLEKLGGA